MNFLSVFIRLALIVVLVSTIVFFGGREAWLFYAAQTLTNDAMDITRVRSWQEYINQCATSTTIDVGGSAFSGLQLRFLDDDSYVLEVRCSNRDPVVRSQHELPFLVTKQYGSAGFFYNFEQQILDGELELSFLGRKRVVYADGDRVRHEWGETNYIAAIPASSCEAHGFRCCDVEREVGVDQGVDAGVTDCPGSCFETCWRRPILLSFQTDPILNYETNTVRMTGSSGLVLFSFAFDETESPVESVRLQFGDGTSETLSAARGNFGKEYRCADTRCVYTATVTAVDERGVESPTTRLSSITVELVNTPQP